MPELQIRTDGQALGRQQQPVRLGQQLTHAGRSSDRPYNCGFTGSPVTVWFGYGGHTGIEPGPYI